VTKHNKITQQSRLEVPRRRSGNSEVTICFWSLEHC